MENSLLIGNGLNLTMSSHSVSWFNLLKDFAKYRKLISNENIPMPLEFERLMNLHMARNSLKNKSDAYSRAKESIANSIKKISSLDSTAVHHKLKSLNVNNILTTNYDGLLESVYGLSSIGALKGNNRYCLLNPTDKISGINFYHIHGLITKPSTMCLGQIHYSKIVKTLQEDLDSKKGCAKKTNTNLRILRILRGEEESDSWGSLFFTTNLGIIGFGLADCEADIWWLLAKRAALYYQDYGGAQSLIKNKIVFYDVVCTDGASEERIDKQKVKHELLEGLHVSVVKVHISNKNDYKKAYELIIDAINRNGISDRIKEYTI